MDRNLNYLFAVLFVGMLVFTAYMVNTPELEPECHKPQQSEILRK